jgi:hypothetical protein
MTIPMRMARDADARTGHVQMKIPTSGLSGQKWGPPGSPSRAKSIFLYFVSRTTVCLTSMAPETLRVASMRLTTRVSGSNSR